MIELYATSEFRDDRITILSKKGKPELQVELDGKSELQLRQTFDRAIAWLHKNKGIAPADLVKKAPKQLIGEINRILCLATDKGITAAALGYELPAEVVDVLKQNVFVFSGMKTYHELRQASELLVTAEGTPKSFDAFKNDVVSIYEDYNVNYLITEYNFASQCAQTAARWQGFEKDGDRYPLQFRTAGDAKVRPDHEELNGTTLPLNDSFWDDFTPPLDWNCRCMVIQVEAEHELSDREEAMTKGEQATTNMVNGVNKSAMFRFNPGKTLTIFPEKHPYMARDASPEDIREAQDIIDAM